MSTNNDKPWLNFKRFSDVNPGPQPTFVPSGISAIDRLLHVGGFVLPSFGIIGARPGVGKTTFALSMLRNTSYRRMLLSIELNEDRVEWMTRRAPRADEESLIIADMSRYRNLSQILEVLEKADRNGIRLAIIDHFGLIRADKFKPHSYEAATEKAERLQEFAYTHQMCLICMAQLHRATKENGEEGEPELDNLKGTGSIEESADFVLSLWSEITARQGKRKGPIDPRLKVKVLKNRWGPPAAAALLEFDRTNAHVYDDANTVVTWPGKVEENEEEDKPPGEASQPGTLDDLLGDNDET